MAKTGGLPSEQPDERLGDLLHAVDIASDARAKALLRRLCLASMDSFELACLELLIPENSANGHANRGRKRDAEDAASDGKDEGEEAGDSTPGMLSSKDVEAINGKRVRYLRCRQCEEEFDSMENNPNACAWHDGELELNKEGEDVEWDWDGEGHAEDEENKEEYPEFFDYNCCDRVGTSKGCKVGWHVADEQTQPKRLRAS